MTAFPFATSHVLAQQNVSSATLRGIIIALLLVAAALGLLTVWYWQRTDPRRRLAQPPRVRVAPTGSSMSGGVSAAGGGVTPTVAPSTRLISGPAPVQASAPVQTPSSFPAATPAPAPSPVQDVDADEWLRLTGPQALPRD